MSADTTAPPTTAEQVRQEIIEATGAAFLAGSAERHRDPHDFSLSGLGGCRRAAAYALSRTPTTDDPGPTEARQANLGTAQHEWLLPRLAAQYPGAQVEKKVRLRAAGLEITGHIDLNTTLYPLDLKTVGEWRLQGVRRVFAAYYHHRVQVGGYTLALHQAGERPRFMAWLYIDRASGDQEVIVEPVTNRTMLAVVDRVTELRWWSERPQEAPRDERGPGLSIVCDGCPWLRACWGDDAVPGQTGVQQVYDRPAIAQALADWRAASDAKSDAVARIKDAEARIGTARFGVYGGLEYRRARSSEVEDPWAAVRILREQGADIPKMHKRGKLIVKRTTLPDTPETTEGDTGAPSPQ